MPNKIECQWLILSALAEEFNAACNQLENPCAVKQWPFPAKSGRIGSATVICVFSGKGGSNTASCLQYAVNHSTVDSVALGGIAGGFPDQKVRRGDVLIGQTIIGYDFGKLVSGKFLRRPELDFQSDISLVRWAEVVANTPWFEGLKVSRPDGADPSVSKVHTGYVASGDKVVDDASHSFFKEVQDAVPEIHGVEMESIGAGASVRLTQSERTLRFILIKGISDEPRTGLENNPDEDSSGSGPRQSWKGYAASASALFISRLIQTQSEPTSLPSSRVLGTRVEVIASQQDHDHIGRLTFSVQDLKQAFRQIQVLEIETLDHWCIPDLSLPGMGTSLMQNLDIATAGKAIIISAESGARARYPVQAKLHDSKASFEIVVIMDQPYLMPEFTVRYLHGLFPVLIKLTLICGDGTHIDAGNAMLSLNGELPSVTQKARRVQKNEYMLTKNSARSALAAIDGQTAVPGELREWIEKVAYDQAPI